MTVDMILIPQFSIFDFVATLLEYWLPGWLYKGPGSTTQGPGYKIQVPRSRVQVSSSFSRKFPQRDFLLEDTGPPRFHSFHIIDVYCIFPKIQDTRWAALLQGCNTWTKLSSILSTPSRFFFTLKTRYNCGLHLLNLWLL